MSPLSDADVDRELRGLDGWARSGERIEKEYRLAGFGDAIAFVVRIAFAAEAADHHPDLDIRYRRVLVGLSTHSEGGITNKDIDLAGQIDGLAP